MLATHHAQLALAAVLELETVLQLALALELELELVLVLALVLVLVPVGALDVWVQVAERVLVLVQDLALTQASAWVLTLTSTWICPSCWLVEDAAVAEKQYVLRGWTQP